MQIKRAARLERLAQPLIRFMGVFATRAEGCAEILWRSKALRDAKVHTARGATAPAATAYKTSLMHANHRMQNNCGMIGGGGVNDW